MELLSVAFEHLIIRHERFENLGDFAGGGDGGVRFILKRAARTIDEICVHLHRGRSITKSETYLGPEPSIQL